MADNLNVPGGSGGPVATDDVSGVQYQRVKVNYGADGSATDVSTTNPMPMTEYADNSVAVASVTVGTSAVALPSSALSGRKAIEVYNNGSVVVYVGPSGVTTASGRPIAVGGSVAYALGPNNVLYGISGSAGQDVRVIEVS